jgi:hypothetical protein
MCRLTVQGKKEAEAGHKIREELFKRGYVSQHETTKFGTQEGRGGWCLSIFKRGGDICFGLLVLGP